MKVLHITVHMGGGIGNSLTGLIEDGLVKTRIIVLQTPDKKEYLEKAKNLGAEIVVNPQNNQIEEAISWADVVIINWWHHPCLYKFLYDFPTIPCRVVMFCHISGCFYPFLNPNFVELFDHVMITSDCILDNKEWTDDQRVKIKEKSSLIYGLGQLDVTNDMLDTIEISGLGKKDFNLGYIGTLSENKIHPDFPVICKKIVDSIPNAHFYLIGDSKEGQWIEDRAEDLGVADHLHLLGYIENAKRTLRNFDVFCYPLNPRNYATTENAILEAMYAKLPVVVMNQGTEKYIIQNKVNGLLGDDIDTFVKKIEYVYKNPNEAKDFGENAYNTVLEKYNSEKNYEKYVFVLNQIISRLEKRTHSFREEIGHNPYHWMLSGTNRIDRELIEKLDLRELSEAFTVKNKSSIFHFANTYPDDVKLQKLVEKLNEEL